MKTTLLYIILPLAIVWSFGCSTGKKAFERGDYEDAVYAALNRLQQAPDNKKARQTIISGYPMFIRYMEGRVRTIQMTDAPLKWEEIFSIYSKMNGVYDELLRTPAAIPLIPNAKSYQSEWTSARRQVLAVRYALGEELLATGDRNAAIEAVEHFERVLHLDSRYRNANNLLAESHETATLYVTIAPSPIQTEYFQAPHTFFEKEVEQFLANHANNRFLKVIPYNVFERTKVDVDHIVKMSFDDFIIGQAYVKETVKECIKDSVLVGTHELKDTTIHTYQKAKATIHHFSKEISSSGRLSLEVIDAVTNLPLASRKFPGTNVLYDEWGYIKGDDRALTEEDWELVAKYEPAPDPDPHTLFLELGKPIFREVSQYLKTLYRRI